MSILFVCKGNVGRSQMAEALFTKLYKRECISAGTVVGDNEGVKIIDIPEASNVINVLSEENIDISGYTRKQLTENMCATVDSIVMMAEPETIPEYVKKHHNIMYRDVENPKGMDYEGHKKVLQKIKEHILSLV